MSEVVQDFSRKVTFLEKKQPLTEKFSKFCSEKIHRLADPRLVCKFREIWPTGSL